jgi:hypothetical protein
MMMMNKRMRHPHYYKIGKITFNARLETRFAKLHVIQLVELE